MEWQIRNWYYFDWLSGDHIVEQHVHQHDATDWVMGAHPVQATAVGGRQMRTEELYGNIFDHFCVDYEYPNGVHVSSMCRQWKGVPGEVCAIFTGTKGTAYVHGSKSGTITGEKPWEFKPGPKDVGPNGKEINGQVFEHRDLIASIRAGEAAERGAPDRRDVAHVDPRPRGRLHGEDDQVRRPDEIRP